MNSLGKTAINLYINKSYFVNLAQWILVVKSYVWFLYLNCKVDSIISYSFNDIY